MNGVSPHISDVVIIVPFICFLSFGGLQKAAFSALNHSNRGKNGFAFVAM